MDAHNKLRKEITLGERRRSLYQVKNQEKNKNHCNGEGGGGY